MSNSVMFKLIVISVTIWFGGFLGSAYITARFDLSDEAMYRGVRLTTLGVIILAIVSSILLK